MTCRAVPRLLAGLLATAAATVAAGALGPRTAAAAEDETTRTPLKVSIEAMAPATIPTRGRLTLTGRITNRSQQTWTDLNVYLFTSPDPIRSRAELATAAVTDASSPVGVRRTAEGLYDEVGDLVPGASVRYRLSVARTDLGISGETGVYWVGVHVLGAGEGGRDSVADGRARTFVPLLPAPGTAAALRTRTRMALVLPLRKPVLRGGAARLLGLRDWNDTLSPDGRLQRLLKLSGRGRQPLTWVVDPAVLDAVQSVAQDNPRLDIGPAAGANGQGGSPSGSPSGTPQDSTSPAPSRTPGGEHGDADESAAEPSAAATRARAWLAEFRRQAPTHTVAALPYGDLDVAAVLDSPFGSLYERATSLGTATLKNHGLDDAFSVVAPVSGYLPETALGRVNAETPVMLDASALPDAPGPVDREAGRAPVVLTDSDAASGGPKPGWTYGALAVRQRLLSDAALHALSDGRDEPLVVTAPPYCDPGAGWSRARFFAGLDQTWLQMTDLPSVVAAATPSRVTGAPEGQAAPVYPRSERAAELPLSNLRATQRLTRTGTVLARVLRDNDTVDDAIARVAMLGSSVSSRSDTAGARSRTASTTGYVRSQMAAVRIEGPPFVMMSGDSGPIQVTLVNDLPQTVTVGLGMSTPGSRLTIAPVDPVTLGPGRRMSIRLEVRSDSIGVHAVTLRVTDPEGVPLGSQAYFNVRTSRVSTVIWVIMVTGAALLMMAIVVRLFRRIRRRKATHGPRLPPDHRKPHQRRPDQPKPGEPTAGPASPDPTTHHRTPADEPDQPGQELKA